MRAVTILADWRADPEPDPADEIPDLDSYAGQEYPSVIGQVADRLASMEARIAKLERRGRL